MNYESVVMDTPEQAIPITALAEAPAPQRAVTRMVAYTTERCAGCGGPIRHDLRFMRKADNKLTELMPDSKDRSMTCEQRLAYAKEIDQNLQVWCSSECQDGRPRKTSVRLCKWCGGSMAGVRADAEYCSEKCRKQYSRRTSKLVDYPGQRPHGINELSVAKIGGGTWVSKKDDQPSDSIQISWLSPGNAIPCQGWNEEYAKLNRHGRRKQRSGQRGAQ
jgi:hypothetical protein